MDNELLNTNSRDIISVIVTKGSDEHIKEIVMLANLRLLLLFIIQKLNNFPRC